MSDRPSEVLCDSLLASTLLLASGCGSVDDPHDMVVDGVMEIRNCISISLGLNQGSAIIVTNDVELALDDEEGENQTMLIECGDPGEHVTLKFIASILESDTMFSFWSEPAHLVEQENGPYDLARIGEGSFACLQPGNVIHYQLIGTGIVGIRVQHTDECP